MKIPDLFNLIKRFTGLIPRHDIEKLIFKALVGAWLVVIAVVIIMRATHEVRDDAEKEIMEAAAGVRYSGKSESEIEKYETLLDLAKYPKKIEKYTQGIKRDPFSKYKEIVITTGVTKYDFVLKVIDRAPLPLVYKGYIELPDKIIGQMNWRDVTRFVEAGSTLNGYKIRSISRGKIDAIDEKGKKIEFELNKPVLGDELQAVLYDNISKKSFDVKLSSEIDNYKVIDIAPNYVILLTKGKEIKLEL